MGLDFLEKVADTYERKARLYPALLALVPLLGVVVGVHGYALEVRSTLIGLLMSFGVFYCAATLARELGKRKEEALFDAWGGKPTTQVLRHRDDRIDPVSKARYHAFLSKKLGTAFPTKDEEASDPEAADAAYRSAAAWLLDQTRDKKKFSLLFEENIAYGFRRNCLGIKPYAIVISLLAIAWAGWATKLVTPAGFEFARMAGLTPGSWASIGVSLAMLVVWTCFFTRATVKTSAFAYAEKLCRACDVLPQPRRTASPHP